MLIVLPQTTHPTAEHPPAAAALRAVRLAPGMAPASPLYARQRDAAGAATPRSAAAQAAHTPPSTHGAGEAQPASMRGLTIDLRRRHTEELADRIRVRAELLPEQERALLEAVYQHGQRLGQVALMMRVSPRTARRRVRGLITRVLSDGFIYVARHRGGWSPRFASVASRVFIEGMTIRGAARASGQSYHTCRCVCAAVRQMLRALPAGGAGRAPVGPGRLPAGDGEGA
ncbi:MAG: hypothetical protein C0513_06735 [Isosphaera sp.]|nr:hypothetical protein [Isosphaera sp.]